VHAVKARTSANCTFLPTKVHIASMRQRDLRFTLRFLNALPNSQFPKADPGIMDRTSQSRR
jgi:hypothetical protein